MPARSMSLMRKVATLGLSLMIAAALCPVSAVATEDEVVPEEPMVAEEVDVVEEEGEAVDAPVEEGDLEEGGSLEDEDAAADASESTSLEELAEGQDASETDGEEDLPLDTMSSRDLYFERYYDSEWGYWDYHVEVDDVRSGSVTYDEETKTLTLDNAVIEGRIHTDINLTIQLIGDSTASYFYTYTDDSLYASITITGDGTLALSDQSECGGLTVLGGTINGRVSCGPLTVSGTGRIEYTGEGTAVGCSSLSMDGGAIVATNCDTGIDVGGYDHTSHNISIKKGTIAIANPSNCGIQVYSGNFTMTGGTVKVTGSYWSGIYVSSDTYRGKTYGGKVVVKGGSLAVGTRYPKNYFAIFANSMTNTVASLRSVIGRLPTGAKFKVLGNVYQVKDYDEVWLTSYGSTKTAATFKNVTYGKYSYRMVGVGPSAFNTKQGKKVKSLAFANELYYLGKGAFKNTVSLTSMKLNLGVYTEWKKNKYVVKKYSGATKFASGCFAGMGKSKGRGLTVRIGYNGETSAYRTFMRKYGLSANVRVSRLH